MQSPDYDTVPLVYALSNQLHRAVAPCPLCAGVGNLGKLENDQITGVALCLECKGAGSIAQGCGGAVETDSQQLTRWCPRCQVFLGPEEVSGSS